MFSRHDVQAHNRESTPSGTSGCSGTTSGGYDHFYPWRPLSYCNLPLAGLALHANLPHATDPGCSNKTRSPTPGHCCIPSTLLAYKAKNGPGPTYHKALITKLNCDKAMDRFTFFHRVCEFVSHCTCVVRVIHHTVRSDEISLLVCFINTGYEMYCDMDVTDKHCMMC